MNSVTPRRDFSNGLKQLMRSRKVRAIDLARLFHPKWGVNERTAATYVSGWRNGDVYGSKWVSGSKDDSARVYLGRLAQILEHLEVEPNDSLVECVRQLDSRFVYPQK